MRYVLGIDQGGSKTHAMIADGNGVILGLGQSKGAVHSSHGIDVAMAQVEKAVNQALQQSNISIEQISIIASGMTGIDWDYEKELLTEEFKKYYPNKQIIIVNDCIIAMRAGTNKDKCCVLCAGSGLNCAVRKDKNHEFVYGFYIPDEYQGGVALGHRTIQAVLDSKIGLEKNTILTQMVCEYLNVANPNELLYQTVTGKIGSSEKIKLPLILEEAALKNDEVALSILSKYGHQIAHYVIAGMKKMDIISSNVDVVLSGSIFKCKLPVLQEAVSSEIHKYAAHATIVNCRYEPIVGAVLLALDEIYDTVLPIVYDNIEKSSLKFNIIR